MAGLQWKLLWMVVAGHAALIAFIIAAFNKDLTSEPTMEAQRTEFGLIHDWVPQPFAFGVCVPGTTDLQQEPYVSVDEGLAKPVYRCTGWSRPLLWSAAAFLAVAIAGLILSLARGLLRRRRS